MKTAIYIEGEISQIILTPETPLETIILNAMKTGQLYATVKFGRFTERRDGFFQESLSDDASSLMIRLFNNDEPVPG